mmetsp:Transcript_142046/g.250460  ORF Transcript_142046/g.250460 Transcript_142046/m.250460 type:complete len:375 (-) Transcript_142046:136-1260(-)
MVLASLPTFSNLASIFSSCREPTSIGVSSSEYELVLESGCHSNAKRQGDQCCADETAKPLTAQHAVSPSSDVDSDASTTDAGSASECGENISVCAFSTVDSGSECGAQSTLSDNCSAEAGLAGASCAAAQRAQILGVDFQESSTSLGSDSRGRWVHDRVREGLECSFHVANGMVHAVTTAEFPSHDPLLAFAAFCEADLCMAYKPNVVNGTLLDEAAADHSLWLVEQRGKFSGRLEDSLVEISAVDALDEPVGSLWVCISTPASEDLAQNWSASIPAAQKGVQRIDSGCTTCWITPLRGPDEKTRGFRMITEVAAPAPAAVSGMPTFALRMAMRRGAQEFADGFQKHIATGGMLDQRMQSSARGKLYARIRERL